MKTIHLLPLLAVCGKIPRLSATARTLPTPLLLPSGNLLVFPVANSFRSNPFRKSVSAPTRACFSAFNPVAPEDRSGPDSALRMGR